MAIAMTLKQYLDDHEIEYDVVTHQETGCSSRTAQVSHIPGDQLAKGVVVKREKGYLLAIVPASRQVKLDMLGQWLKQPVSMATEEESSTLFKDCERGAVPPIGPAYGIRTVIDDSLEGQEDIYFEGGDHRTLVHLTGDQFHRLMEKIPHEPFSTQPASPV